MGKKALFIHILNSYGQLTLSPIGSSCPNFVFMNFSPFHGFEFLCLASWINCSMWSQDGHWSSRCTPLALLSENWKSHRVFSNLFLILIACPPLNHSICFKEDDYTDWSSWSSTPGTGRWSRPHLRGLWIGEEGFSRERWVEGGCF